MIPNGGVFHQLAAPRIKNLAQRAEGGQRAPAEFRGPSESELGQGDHDLLVAGNRQMIRTRL